MTDVTWKKSDDIISKTVAAKRRAAAMSQRQESGAQGFSLYAYDGSRKYLNQHERQRVLAAMAKLPPERALFALTLAWTGARVSEVLALSAASFQVEAGVVAIRTLKRRRPMVREVPIPPWLMGKLESHFGLTVAQSDERRADRPLWRWHRATAWQFIKDVMATVGITGRHASPRGLRHAFGVGTLQAGVPLNLTQRWLGHSQLRTTAIYAAVCGPEEMAFASLFWHAGRACAKASA